MWLTRPISNSFNFKNHKTHDRCHFIPDNFQCRKWQWRSRLSTRLYVCARVCVRVICCHPCESFKDFSQSVSPPWRGSVPPPPWYTVACCLARRGKRNGVMRGHPTCYLNLGGKGLNIFEKMPLSILSHAALFQSFGVLPSCHNSNQYQFSKITQLVYLLID